MLYQREPICSVFPELQSPPPKATMVGQFVLKGGLSCESLGLLHARTITTFTLAGALISPPALTTSSKTASRFVAPCTKSLTVGFGTLVGVNVRGGPLTTLHAYSSGAELFGANDPDPSRVIGL